MSGISFASAVCVSVNLMMGSGFLALPHAWYQGGDIASGIALILVVAIMCICAVLEARFILKGSRFLQPLSHHVCEVAEVVRLCCGELWRGIYLAVLCISLGGCMWTYAVVFGRSFAQYLFPSSCSGDDSAADMTGDCLQKYHYGIALLAVVTTPLCLIEVKEQISFQLMMTAMRVLLVLLMIATALSAYVLNDIDSSFSHGTRVRSVQNGSVVYFISAASFALFLNSNVPVVINALQRGVCIEKVLVTAFLCCCLLYGGLSVVLASTLSASLMSPCNLNWAGFRWPGAGVSCSVACDTSARMLEILVVLFPAIDVLSVYPINTMILASSLAPAATSSSSCHNIDNNVATVSLSCANLTRAAINALPLMLAALFMDFTALIDYSGVMSLLICFVFPAFISLQFDRNISTTNDVELTPLTDDTNKGDTREYSVINCNVLFSCLSRAIESPLLKGSVLVIGISLMAVIIAKGAYK